MFRGKAIVVLGARQVGKSTLLRMIVDDRKEPRISLNCDEPEDRALLEGANMQRLRDIIGDNRIVVIDEAQRVRNVGLTLKLITDSMPNVQLLVTGSSSLDLASSVVEPLTGRMFEYNLPPISTSELKRDRGLLGVTKTLESRLIYGSYPDVINNTDEAADIVSQLAESYLYRDLLSFEGLRRPSLLPKLLQALALQLTSEVSFNEIASIVGVDKKTVDKYIYLLEQCFVIFHLDAFSRNLRNELKRSKKIYFYDNGIRNAVLGRFAPLSLRDDCGALWENFIISERRKTIMNSGLRSKGYFWRTQAQQEIDYVEELDGRFSVFEMKWNPRKANAKIPKVFTDNYDVKECRVVTPDDWVSAVCGV